MDVKEFQSVVMPYSHRLWIVASGMLRNDDDAHDAVQDALAALWSNRHRLNSIDNVEAYCVSIVKNIALDKLRRRRFQAEAPPNAEPAHDPLLNIDNKSELRQLQSLIKQLSPDQQEAITLSAFRGLSNDEISSATGWPSANVRAILSRGRKKLKELYTKSQL